MSTELLHYCAKALHKRPRALNITQPLDDRARSAFIRAWSKLRFKEQQKSILQLSPDHPDYGRGYLWPYTLKWGEEAKPSALPPNNPEASSLLLGASYLPSSTVSISLRIEHQPNTVASPRELILLASVSQVTIPFLDPAGKPYSRHTFRSAKSRLLGGEARRSSAAVFPALRAGVANVQYLCQNGSIMLSAIHLADVVSIEE